MAPDLDALVNPRSVAVIGATESPGKPGRIVVENMLGGRIPLYPVHPARTSVLGLPAVPRVADVPADVDLAVVATAAEAAVESAEQCVARGVPFVIVLAGGFGETGEAGRLLERRLVSALSGSRTRLLGPNTLGLLVPGAGLDTVFVDHAAAGLQAPSGVAIVSQSGSVAEELITREALTGFPLAAFIGLGNSIDLRATDFVDYFGRQESVCCLGVYLEHLGEGRELLEAARRASRRMPVFFLKAGRTASGGAAVASHTGRLAGSDRVVAGALRQYGIQRVADDEELGDAARAVACARLPGGNRVAIVTPAGGYGVMCVDYVEDDQQPVGLQMAVLSAACSAAIRASALPFASAANPVDLTAGTDDDGIAAALRAVLADEGVDIVILIALFAPAGITERLIPLVAEAVRESPRTLVVFSQAADRSVSVARAFYEAGIAAYPSISRAVRAVRLLVERAGISRSLV